MQRKKATVGYVPVASLKQVGFRVVEFTSERRETQSIGIRKPLLKVTLWPDIAREVGMVDSVTTSRKFTRQLRLERMSGEIVNKDPHIACQLRL